ncbi:hypothetical protein [Rubritalea halochordaticola]
MKMIRILFCCVCMVSCSSSDSEEGQQEWRFRSIIGLPPEVPLICKEISDGYAEFEMECQRDAATSWLYQWGDGGNFQYMTLTDFDKETWDQLNRVDGYKLRLGDVSYDDGISNTEYRVEAYLEKISLDRCRIKVEVSFLEKKATKLQP